MSLTDDENRQLAGIETALHRADPDLARHLAGPRRHSRRFWIGTLVGALVVLSTLVVGVCLQQRIVCAVAWCGVLVGMLWWGIAGDDAD